MELVVFLLISVFAYVFFVPGRRRRKRPKGRYRPVERRRPSSPPTQTQTTKLVVRRRYERTTVIRKTLPADPERPTVPARIVGPAYVVDGDTIVINKTSIRLFGIDAPEMDHPYGIKAKWAMVHLCKGQVVTAVPVLGAFSYERCVARCYLPDGRDLSAELVKQGLAIDWPKFSGGEYRHLEVEGVRKKLWRAHNRQVGGPIPPLRPREGAVVKKL
ncbi:thermonuclease family protein [Maritimibacter sp. DP1N21-5]|uniref:thermonuclease family protein n=1 Tax=Maritimibacter sp. DP1N21-5 TaxID=2836867 RepID=UPI0021048741|nr:thermonuclease family protein [Maritimibacter sp. DP1N21-5]